MVSDEIKKKHVQRKERVRQVYDAIAAESKKARPNFGKVAVDANLSGISKADIWRAFDAAAYVTEVFDPDDFSKVHRAMEKAGLEKPKE